MATITIDGKDLEVDNNLTIIQAARNNGIEYTALLLAPATLCCRQLPDVPCRSGEDAQARDRLFHAGNKRA